MKIMPAVRGLVVCESHKDYTDGRIDLLGIYNKIEPLTPYPYTRTQLGVYAQLVNGSGNVPFRILVVNAGEEEVFSTETHELHFPNRSTIVQLMMRINGCKFPEPGVYLVQLYCYDSWICDTTIRLV